MPFNGGIGIHDASWKNGLFGGSTYLTNGSHCCINTPPSVAKKYLIILRLILQLFVINSVLIKYRYTHLYECIYIMAFIFLPLF